MDRVRSARTVVVRHRRGFAASADAVVWVLAMVAGAAVRVGGMPRRLGPEFVLVLAVAVAVQLAGGYLTGLYRGRWRSATFEETFGLTVVWFAASCTAILVNLAFPDRPFPIGATMTGSVLAGAGMVLVRGLWRMQFERGRRPNVTGRRVVVFGAGEGGALAIRAMMTDPTSQYVPVALLDDGPGKARRSIHGVRVMGDRNALAEVATQTSAEVLLIAVPSARSSLVRELSQAGLAAGLEVRILPRPRDLPSDFTVSSIAKVTENDLLGRDEVTVDLGTIVRFVTGRRVLVTGAGGSIGSELCRQLVAFGAERVYMLDRDESGLHGVQLSIEGRALLDSDALIVADIRDRDRMRTLLAEIRPDVVFHAAALKHLPLLERHPIEGLKTNVWGTENVLEAALAAGVGRFVNVSTDKAADPESVLGATKLIAERMTARAAAASGWPYVSVRFGNVLGSRGSVVPTFREQIAHGGPVTVTDPEVTRYFMTIPEAVRLVIQAGALGEPGETMILDMGEPVRIADLARQMIDSIDPDVELVFTGLRPGEKLHEVLVSETDRLAPSEHERIFRTTVSPLANGFALGLPDLLGGDEVKRLLIAVATDGGSQRVEGLA